MVKRKIPGSELNGSPELSSLSLDGVEMDANRQKQCLTLLKKLMQHQYGWVFNQPVDPVKLGIPDYFSIIKNPMDLGTINQKLLKGFYASTVQFAQDVRLTFSNAMLYNPPMNGVHKMAKNLCNVFEARWRLLEDKWAKETFSSRLPEDGLAKKKVVLTVSCAVKARPSEPLTPRNAETSIQDSVQASYKGGTGKPQSGIRIEKRSDNGRLVLKLGSCNRHSGVDKDKYKRNDDMSRNLILPKKEVTEIHQKPSGMQLPSTEKISVSNEVDECRLEVPLSPNRALRAATLKSRFADTIARAQQRALLDQGSKFDLAKLQKEKEKLQRMQQEEKLRLEAEIRAAQAAARKKAEADRKLKREKEREAARLCLQQIKKTVDLDNSELLKDLDRLNLTWTCHKRKSKEYKQNLTYGFETKTGFLNPLEKLGLFLKVEDIDDDDLEIPTKVNIEKGEIC